jgi:hypothetical protein
MYDVEQGLLLPNRLDRISFRRNVLGAALSGAYFFNLYRMNNQEPACLRSTERKIVPWQQTLQALFIPAA